MEDFGQIEKPTNSFILSELFRLYPEIERQAKNIALNILHQHPALIKHYNDDDLYQMAITKLLTSGVSLDFFEKERESPQFRFLALFRRALNFICLDEGRKVSGKSKDGTGRKAHYNELSFDEKIPLKDGMLDIEDLLIEKTKIIERLKDVPWFIRIAVLEYLEIELPPFYPENENQRIIYEALVNMKPDNSPFVQYCLNHLRRVNKSSYTFNPKKGKYIGEYFMKKLASLNEIPTEEFEKNYKKLNKREIDIFARYYIKSEDMPAIMSDYNLSQGRVSQILRDIRIKLKETDLDIKVA